MARVSTSSSAANSNGHPHPPINAEDSGPPKRLTPNPVLEESADELDSDTPKCATQVQALPYDPSLLPTGRRSLSSISLQAFSLGFVFAICSSATIMLLRENKSIWRLPAFLACLSAFHFLEFWTTAQYNTPVARASSFLLRNGKAYTVAHGLATTEIMISAFLPSYQSLLVNPHSITAGAVLVAAGQLLRSAAMAEAGTNFNHTLAKIKREGHVLVTTGVYAWLRHPSYCAFFWWALGTQVLVGNKICFLGYLFVLWNFFKRRIKGESESIDILVQLANKLDRRGTDPCGLLWSRLRRVSRANRHRNSLHTIEDYFSCRRKLTSPLNFSFRPCSCISSIYLAPKAKGMIMTVQRYNEIWNQLKCTRPYVRIMFLGCIRSKYQKFVYRTHRPRKSLVRVISNNKSSKETVVGPPTNES